MEQVKYPLSSLSRTYPFKFFEGSLPQILRGQFLNTWTHMLWGEGHPCASANLRTLINRESE